MKTASFTIIRATHTDPSEDDRDEPLRVLYTGLYRNDERIHHGYGDLADHELLGHCIGFTVLRVMVMEFRFDHELGEGEIFPATLAELKERLSLVQIEESTEE